jgi:HK97 family phage portal protein
MEAQMATMGQVPTLFSIVNRTSNATSQVNWRLWRVAQDGRRRTGTGDEPVRTEVTRHALLDVWNHPNDFYTRQAFVETVQQHLDLVGEGAIAIVKNVFGWPEELWPVRPDRIEPVPHPTKFLAGYVYTSPSGEKVPLAVDELLHIKMPNPLDPYRGLGPVQAAMIDIDSSIYSAQWNRNFFINSAEPGGIIEVEKRLSDSDYNEMVKRWSEQHKGVSAAHRVGILEQGKWKSAAFSQRDMQFAELRDLSDKILRTAFGIHSHMLGLSENVNKANADAGEVSFARWLVSPRIARWKGELNTKLLPMFGESTTSGLELDNDRVVPEDREADDRERLSKTTAYSTLVTAGVAPDDAAMVCGLPPMTNNGPVAPALPAA